MKSNKLATVKSQYDCIVIGGGIVGAGILRDLASHGVDSLLVDKKDFCSQTSSKSSKMLHGGLRYLENFDFALVKEALHEKNLWLKLAPHLGHDQSFVLPVYRDSLRPLWMVKIGLVLYDFLSGFKNKAHKVLSKNKTLSLIPQLKEDTLTGAGLYHDGVVDDLKLGLELILDAIDKGGQALNYVSLEDFIFKDAEVECLLKDEIHGIQKFVKTKKLIFALGPYTDKFLGQTKAIKWSPVLIPSKGIHIRIPKEKLPISHAVVLTPNDKRVIFVIPHDDHILVGTTESAPENDFFETQATQADLDYLLKNLNEFFPNIEVTKADILSHFSGIRPLVADPDSSDRSKTSRDHHVYRPNKNVHVIVGGKYTTFRTMAAQIARPIIHALGGSYNENLSKQSLEFKTKNEVIDRNSIERILQTQEVRTFDDLVIRRLNVYTKEHWPAKEDFDSFFQENADLLSKYLDKFEGNEIQNFH